MVGIKGYDREAAYDFFERNHQYHVGGIILYDEDILQILLRYTTYDHNNNFLVLQIISKNLAPILYLLVLIRKAEK